MGGRDDARAAVYPIAASSVLRHPTATRARDVAVMVESGLEKTSPFQRDDGGGEDNRTVCELFDAGRISEGSAFPSSRPARFHASLRAKS